MTTSIRAAPPEHFTWLSERIHYTPKADFRAIEAVDDSTGEIVGMVGFDHWWPNSVQMHWAGSGARARALIRPAFSYPFDECARDVVLGFTRAGLVRECDFVLRLGFREAHRIEDGWAKGEDMVVFEMRKHECRWLKRQERT